MIPGVSKNVHSFTGFKIKGVCDGDHGVGCQGRMLRKVVISLKKVRTDLGEGQG